MLIQHITLASGNTATHRLDTIMPEALAVCRALLPAGGMVPNCSPFRVEIHPPVFTIYRGQEPVATCGYGRGRDDTWNLLVEMQERFVPVAVKSAPAAQWLAVVLLPGLTTLSKTDLGWLADFERCLTAAMLLPTPKNS